MKWIEDSRILECKAGSHAYGLDTPQSDLDFRGIVIPPIEYLLGLKKFDQMEAREPDRVLYSLRKFFELASACNPNIIEIIFTPRKHVLLIDKWGEMLMENATLFLSKKAKHTFSGYAFAQLQRIQRHKKWLDNPPDEPNPVNYTRKKHIVVKRSQDGVVMPTPVDKYAYERWEGEKFIQDAFLQSEYDADVKKYQQYHTWLKERNTKRAELESKFHYDTKHASHLVRLLRMGVEILEGNSVIVDRNDAGDADELRAIRGGKFTYEELLAYAQDMEKKLDGLYETSSLPHGIDENKINDLYMEMVKGRLGIITRKLLDE